MADDERLRAGSLPPGVRRVAVDDRVLARLASTETAQSPVAVFAIPAPRIPATGHLIVAWGVGDPGNVGALIRVAAAFGMGFVTGPGTADPWSPKVLRAAAGGHFRTTIGEAATATTLGRPLLATVVHGGEHPQRLVGAVDHAVLIGDEAAGLPPELVAAAERTVTIPMPGGTESLNAGAAAAIVAYELATAEGAGPGH